MMTMASSAASSAIPPSSPTLSVISSMNGVMETTSCAATEGNLNLRFGELKLEVERECNSGNNPAELSSSIDNTTQFTGSDHNDKLSNEKSKILIENSTPQSSSDRPANPVDDSIEVKLRIADSMRPDTSGDLSLVNANVVSDSASVEESAINKENPTSTFTELSSTKFEPPAENSKENTTLSTSATATVPATPNPSVSSSIGSRKSSAPSFNGSTAPNDSDQDRRTQELIKKQMNEIEKELSRRLQNKNVKKMNEAELAQLLNDHVFAGGFAAGDSASPVKLTDEASLPCRAPTASDTSPAVSTASVRPTLDQLRSSFSPPDASFVASGADFTAAATTPAAGGFYDAFGNFLPQLSSFAAQTQPAQYQPMMNSHQFHQMSGRSLAESFPQVSQSQSFGATLTGGGLGLHGPAAFLTSPVMPQQQQQQPQTAQFSAQSQMPASVSYTTMLRAGGIPLMANASMPAAFHPAQMPFYNNFQQQLYRQQMQQQQQQQPIPGQEQQQQQFGIASTVAQSNVPSPPLPFATVLTPTMSGITNEMAAILLQQLQQENPGLIENLVDQRNRSNASIASADANANASSFQTTPAPVPATTAVSTTNGAAAPNAKLPAPPQPLPQNSVHTTKTQQKSFHVRAANAQPPSEAAVAEEENGWHELGKRHSADGGDTKANNNNNAGGNGVASGAGAEPVWVMRDSYLKRLEREERRNQELLGEIASTSEENAAKEWENDTSLNASAKNAAAAAASENETDKLLLDGGADASHDDAKTPKTPVTPNSKKEVMVHEPAVLIEGVLFRARYLGSTQLTTDGRPTKTSRMAQAQEAVARVKAPTGEIQPSTEIDLFISTEKIMVLNTDLQRISETDVRQDILMDHALRSISYIADIGDLVVLMARRVPQPADAAVGSTDIDDDGIAQAPRIVCHVFESDEASFIAQSIGQAFQVAYVEFLRANGIDDPAYLREIDYQEVLNSQELMGEELAMFARKETQKDVVISKKVGEPLGIVVVESGWGSILPTVVVANMAPGGPASRSNQLNIGDQIIGINGISLVGLPLATAQQNIKNAKTSTAVRLTVVSTPPVVEVRIKRPNTKYQLGFSVQNGVICSLLRGGIAERGGIRVGHRIIEINHQSVVAVAHERIVNMLATATGEIHMKTMPTSMFRLLTGQEVPNYI